MPNFADNYNWNKDASGTLINPATFEKQSEQITQLTSAVSKLTDILTAQTDGSQKSQVVDSLGNAAHSTQDINGEWHIGVHSIQHVIKVDGNSSTANLAIDASFIGSSTSTSGAGTIIISLYSDQNCTVTVEQSDDETNWDISDPFIYTNYKGNFSQSVDVQSGFFRVIVTNTGVATTTAFRLSCRIKPVSSVLPRTLCPKTGCLKTVVNGVSDQHGFPVENTPTGEQRTAKVSLLVGSPFDGTTLDSSFWNNQDTNGGTIAVSGGTATLSTNTTANGAEVLWSTLRGMYIPGQTNRFRMISSISTDTTDNVRRWGIAYGSTMPTITDGAFFAINGSGNIEIHVYKGGSLTTITSFNGDLGTTVASNTDVHAWEIYYSASAIYFAVDETLVHTLESVSDRWSDTASFYLYADNVNSNSSTTNNNIKIHSAGISRFGQFSAQRIYDYQSGQIAAKTIKQTLGSLEKIIISDISQSSVVVLYDNTAASGDILFSTGTMSSQAIPLTIEFGGIQFNNGLTLAITGADCNTTITYY